MRKLALFVVFFALCSVLTTQVLLSQQKGGAKEPLPDRVDKAIDKGAAYLKGKYKGKDFKGEYDALVMLTLLHADLKKEDPMIKKAAKDLLGRKIDGNYFVSLMAMAYEAYDPFEYQDRIFECAQFLVDSQCANGQWTYGCPGWKSDVKSGGKKAAVSSGGGKQEKIAGRLEVKANNQQTSPDGDNSNAQYALLGLRSASNANIIIPKETWEKAASVLRGRQMADGGWCYSVTGANDDFSYGSMSTAGLGGLTIAKFYLGEDIEKDGSISRGKDWFANNFMVDKNPGPTDPNAIKCRIEKNLGDTLVHYYYLYGLERTGIFCKVDKFGTHDWYKEGAEYLLSVQEKEGKWGSGVTETCFAILFLKRATQPLKPVESGFVPKDAPQDK